MEKGNLIMKIQLTKKLADEMKIKVVKPEENQEEQLFCWHANMFKIGRTKCVMVMNNVTRYHFMIYGLLKKDFANLEEIIFKEIISNFYGDDYSSDQVNAYLNQMGEIQYTATNNRSIISQLNDAILMTQHTFYYKAERGETVFLYDLNRNLNQTPMVKMKDYPINMMRKALEGLLKE